MSKKNDDESCSPCELAVSLGTTLRVCRRLGNKKKCRELYKKIEDDRISPEQVFKTVKKLAKGHKKELEILDEVDRFMKRGKHAKSKRKKK